MNSFERNADKNIKALIVEHSYVDLSILGPYIAKYITMTTGEEYIFQPNAVMYSVHRIKDGETESDAHIAMHYILLIKASAKKDEYIRGYNKDLSDIEESKDGIILFKSNAERNLNYGEQSFTYPNDINGRPVDSTTRKLPFYYLDEHGELCQSYENLGFMYSIIDSMIEKRIELEMTEVETSLVSAVREYVKIKEAGKGK